MNKIQILMKHQFSGARDAMTTAEIDAEARRIDIRMETHARTPFVSMRLLESFVFGVLKEQGFVVFNDDDVDSWTPARTDWTVFVWFGETRFRVHIWNQRPSGDWPQREIELELTECHG